ncbi:hypothetical protein AFLA_003864 [Aspergillus flavus NRRL3357]|nr:hypothetical protein AFLA_003864 [Aspergillus flavus NRRL3357]
MPVREYRVILFFSMLFALPSPEIRAIWLHFEQTCPCFEVVNVTLISQIGQIIYDHTGVCLKLGSTVATLFGKHTETETTMSAGIFKSLSTTV